MLAIRSLSCELIVTIIGIQQSMPGLRVLEISGIFNAKARQRIWPEIGSWNL
jgi:hypothetical protein